MSNSSCLKQENFLLILLVFHFLSVRRTSERLFVRVLCADITEPFFSIFPSLSTVWMKASFCNVHREQVFYTWILHSVGLNASWTKTQESVVCSSQMFLFILWKDSLGKRETSFEAGIQDPLTSHKKKILVWPFFDLKMPGNPVRSKATSPGTGMYIPFIFCFLLCWNRSAMCFCSVGNFLRLVLVFRLEGCVRTAVMSQKSLMC